MIENGRGKVLKALSTLAAAVSCKFPAAFFPVGEPKKNN
jgi:hypothetical protein